ncbi:hypothetical protein BH23GEM9_BH23GEM9_05710 [soil metagenome]
MVERVRLEASGALGEGAGNRVAGAVADALRYRDDAVEHDHDPRYLHPARTVLILLSDVGCRSAAVLLAAAFADSVDRGLAPAIDASGDVLQTGAAALLHQVPFPAEEDEDDEDGGLLERLVYVDDAVAVIALAERLDQARHLHLRPELDWHRFHAGIEAVYVPAARRFSPPLGRRFERWAEAFRRRLLPRR